MLFQKGDLVRGTKPWNESTLVGIVLYSRKVKKIGSVQSFLVHWINSTKNKMTNKPSFKTWEVATSLEKIQNEN